MIANIEIRDTNFGTDCIPYLMVFVKDNLCVCVCERERESLDGQRTKPTHKYMDKSQRENVPPCEDETALLRTRSKQMQRRRHQHDLKTFFSNLNSRLRKQKQVID